MKQVLAITVIAGAALVLAPRAHAQEAVIDVANLAENVQQLAQDIAAVQQLQAQLTQLQQTYAMFTNPTNILSMATGLQNQALQNPMPAVSALTSLLGGQAAPSGAGATFYSLNHIYSPTGSSPYATQLTGNAQGIANLEGIASTNLSAIQARLQQFPELESDLNGATSVTQVAAINGRIAAESQFVQAQQAQATNLQVLASEQQASEQQQQREQFAQDVASFSTTLQQAAAANGAP